VGYKVNAVINAVLPRKKEAAPASQSEGETGAAELR